MFHGSGVGHLTAVVGIARVADIPKTEHDTKAAHVAPCRAFCVRAVARYRPLVAGDAVDALAQEVGVAVVTRVLLDHVRQYPTQ